MTWNRETPSEYKRFTLEKLNYVYIYYVHRNPRYHDNIDMCYSISISHINQIVVYVEQFHFKSCSAIPDEIIRTNCNSKIIQPWVMGYRQSFLILSAKTQNNQFLLTGEYSHQNILSYDDLTKVFY